MTYTCIIIGLVLNNAYSLQSLFFLDLFLCQTAIAQRHHFISYSVENGLAQSQVQDIIQSKDGSEIVLEIKDNGIGIATSLSQKTGTSYHVSNGMKITRQRLEVLKSMT